MSTLFYSPAVRVLIEVQRRDNGAYEIVDVSDDISSGSLTLTQNGSHSLSLTLINHRRKYDGWFTPNDRVIVQMRRINWLQVFAGYLTEVPLFSAIARSVKITAECPLKRLRYHPYDPGLKAYADFMNSYSFKDNTNNDGGMSERIKGVLTKIVGWDENAIHIGRIPDEWVHTIDKLYTDLEPKLSRGKELMGDASVAPNGTSGQDPASTTPFGNMGQPGAPSATGSTSTPIPVLSFADGPDPGGSGGIMRGNTLAAWNFIKANWPKATLNSGVRPNDGPKSPHRNGIALDIGSTYGDPNTNMESRAYLNSIALWFAMNPQAFGLSQLIWRHRLNEGQGWTRPSDFAPGTNTGGADNEHIHHLHIGMSSNNPGQIGPMGSPWVGATSADVDPVVPAGPLPNIGSITSTNRTSNSSINKPLIDANAWTFTPDGTSMMLTGYRTLLNDTPEITPLISQLCHIGQRSFCSAPNGDFIAWFPDYFGLYGTAGRVRIEPIELMDFTVAWSDARLKTHEFVVGSQQGFGQESASVEQAANITFTHGIASVDFPQIIAALMNVQEDDPIWGTPQKILDRFGARPETQPFSSTQMFSSKETEFWAAIWKFTYNWATQFSSNIPITFMPELFPGMILEVPFLKFQAYVEQVTHTFGFAHGEGFRTNARVVAPSVTDGTGIVGFVAGRADPDKMLAIRATPLGTLQGDNLPTTPTIDRPVGPVENE